MFLRSADPKALGAWYAKHLGIEISFAATADEMIAQARVLQPTLLIFDLNSQKMDAVATIAALKADAETAGLRDVRTRGQSAYQPALRMP